MVLCAPRRVYQRKEVVIDARTPPVGKKVIFFKNKKTGHVMHCAPSDQRSRTNCKRFRHFTSRKQFRHRACIGCAIPLTEASNVSKGKKKKKLPWQARADHRHGHTEPIFIKKNIPADHQITLARYAQQSNLLLL